MSKTNDLIDFMHSLTREMGSEYERIQKRSTEDAGTAGDQGEENWATVFRNWLPADYQVVTKGRLLSEKGIASPQVDVIILHPFYPKQLLDKKLYLTAGVAAAFECKNTLKSSHIEKAVQNSTEIRNLIKLKPATYHEELYSPIIYGLIAHSHSWKGDKSTPDDNIHSKLIEADLKYVTHPRECLDFICVSDLAVWSSYKMPMSMYTFEQEGKPFFKWIPGVQTAYGVSNRKMFSVDSEPYRNYTPIGTFLSRLLKKLAITDKRLKDFSWYFGQAVGGGASLNWREWGEKILTKDARRDLIVNAAKYQQTSFMIDA
jgi:hypothetical protein